MPRASVRCGRVRLTGTLGVQAGRLARHSISRQSDRRRRREGQLLAGVQQANLRERESARLRRSLPCWTSSGSAKLRRSRSDRLIAASDGFRKLRDAAWSHLRLPVRDGTSILACGSNRFCMPIGIQNSRSTNRAASLLSTRRESLPATGFRPATRAASATRRPAAFASSRLAPRPRDARVSARSVVLAADIPMPGSP
jgi:hypothetical protein